VRIGVGRPENPKIEVADYLLSDFTDDELTKIKDFAPQITQEILTLIIRSS
jgi:peptidyl-tRNA hydrolase